MNSNYPTSHNVPVAPCSQAMAHIDEFIDDELIGSLREGIASHLINCPGCRAEFEQEEALKRLVRRTCACNEVPDAVRRRVEMRISQLRVQIDQVGSEALGFEQITFTAQWGTRGNDAEGRS